jgi:hypothetical protein
MPTLSCHACSNHRVPYYHYNCVWIVLLFSVICINGGMFLACRRLVQDLIGHILLEPKYDSVYTPIVFLCRTLIQDALVTFTLFVRNIVIPI